MNDSEKIMYFYNLFDQKLLFYFLHNILRKNLHKKIFRTTL